MMTVNAVSNLTGVSVRTLQYYDTIGLLKPSDYTKAGYRLYAPDALERLQQILLFRELEFSLKEIKEILDSPHFDKEKALEQQINLLLLKKEHIEQLINFARQIKTIGVDNMDFSVFDKKKIDEYSKQAKEQWGHTKEYEEYEEKWKKTTDDCKDTINQNFMLIFAEFGKMKEQNFTDTLVQSQVKKLQDFITKHYYTCSKEILSGLGKMYACGGEFTDNIDRYGGEGTAVFVAKAIEFYCK